jgi:hypothetical protein
VRMGGERRAMTRRGTTGILLVVVTRGR